MGFSEVKCMRSILVVVDKFFKYKIFIPAPHACLVDVVVELIMRNMVYFGLPDDIISDKDSRFTRRF